MVDVFVPKGKVEFPPICPMCLKSGPSTKVTVSDKHGDLSCEVAYCNKCANKIGWRGLDWYGPAVRLREVGNASVVFQFQSPRYAEVFLEINPAAFRPNRGWRLKLRLKKLLILLLKFAVVYFLYLGIVLPFAHAAVAEIVPWIGIPFGLAVVYVWAQLMKRTKQK
jgi:hypothetical protein